MTHSARRDPPAHKRLPEPQTDNSHDDYDADDDITKSVAEGFRAIRERKAAGGKGWGE